MTTPSAVTAAEIEHAIRNVADFPKPGILFRDITPLLADPSAMALSIELLANPFRGKRIDLVVGAESWRVLAPFSCKVPEVKYNDTPAPVRTTTLMDASTRR